MKGSGHDERNSLSQALRQLPGDPNGHVLPLVVAAAEEPADGDESLAILPAGKSGALDRRRRIDDTDGWTAQAAKASKAAHVPADEVRVDPHLVERLQVGPVDLEVLLGGLEGELAEVDVPASAERRDRRADLVAEDSSQIDFASPDGFEGR